MKSLLTLISFLSLSIHLNASPLQGKVIDVTDGDTFILLVGNQTIKIRIYGIDAPEKGQPFGQRAKDGLSKLIYGQQVQIEKEKNDRNGITIGKVTKDNNVDVGASLVAYGYSWVNRKYIKDPYLFSLEKKAKEQQIGLWALPVKERIPPWAWKHGEKYKNSKFVYEDSKEPSKYNQSKQRTTSAYKSEVERAQFTGNYYKGNKVHTGPRGGRYIYTNSGNKRYLYE